MIKKKIGFRLYPKVQNKKSVIVFTILAGLLGGLYGVAHDQLTYGISPEYFTEFKFHQFDYLNFNGSDRLFVSLIGFIAVGAVGRFIGWLLARIRFYSDDLSTASRDVLLGFSLVFVFSLLGFFLGGILGYLRAFNFPLQGFMGWEKILSGLYLQKFVVVGYIHTAGYIGGLIGLIIAAKLLKNKVMRS